MTKTRFTHTSTVDEKTPTRTFREIMLKLIHHPTANWSHLCRPQRNRPTATGEARAKAHTIALALRNVANPRRATSSCGFPDRTMLRGSGRKGESRLQMAAWILKKSETNQR